MFNKNFLKAYVLTSCQLISLIIVTFIASILFVMNSASVYPFLGLLQTMQQTSEISTQLIDNIPLFYKFMAYLIALLLSYIITLAGVLSVFDKLIINQLENKKFNVKEWLFEWFRYSSVLLLFLIFLYFAFYSIRNILLLTAIIIVSSYIVYYIILLMHLHLSLKKTALRALLLFISYILLVIISILLIGLLKWFGLLIGILLLIFLLSWSKIYLKKR